MRIHQIKHSFFDDARVKPLWQDSEIEFYENFTSHQVQIHEGTNISQGLLCLANNILAVTEDSSIRWIDINGAQVEHFYSPLLGPGLTIQISNQAVTFYGDVDIVFQSMKTQVIQLNFLKNYSLIKKIGKGNFAEVFKIQSRANSKQYAAKCIMKKQQNIVDNDSIKKEISIMRQMNSTQVISFHEVYENEEYIYIVLELLNGRDLHQAIKESPPFSEQSTQIIIQQLLQGVAYIHSKGVMHRDIKPQNIMLRSEGSCNNLCIVDFGMAEYYNEEGNYQFTRCGTPGYVAPEVLRDQKYDYKVDVYCVGIIMYQLLSGQSPFYANSYDDIITLNYQGIIDYSKVKLSPMGMDLLHQLLEFNPQIRLNAKTALDHTWFSQTQLSRSCQFKVNNVQTLMKRKLKELTPNTPKNHPILMLSPQSCRTKKHFKLDPIDSQQQTIKINNGAVTLRKSIFKSK